MPKVKKNKSPVHSDSSKASLRTNPQTLPQQALKETKSQTQVKIQQQQQQQGLNAEVEQIEAERENYSKKTGPAHPKNAQKNSNIVRGNKTQVGENHKQESQQFGEAIQVAKDGILSRMEQLEKELVKEKELVSKDTENGKMISHKTTTIPTSQNALKQGQSANVTQSSYAELKKRGKPDENTQNTYSKGSSEVVERVQNSKEKSVTTNAHKAKQNREQIISQNQIEQTSVSNQKTSANSEAKLKYRLEKVEAETRLNNHQTENAKKSHANFRRNESAESK